MSLKIKSVKYLVQGRVQNVGFRFFTARNAIKLGICGEVRNLEKGKVLVIAQGEEYKLKELEFLLFNGPKWAKVIDLQSKIINNCRTYSEFSIIRE